MIHDSNRDQRTNTNEQRDESRGTRPVYGKGIRRSRAAHAVAGVGLLCLLASMPTMIEADGGGFNRTVRVDLSTANEGEVPSRNTGAVFVGAYVDLGRCIDAKDDPAARERTIGEHLDRMRQAGLNAVLPYANTSSWSVNYPSEIVTRKPYGEWDPLAVFVNGARQRGMSVWPAICVCSSGHFEPQGILRDHPEWAIRDPGGKPLGFLSPAHPEARRWLVSVLREIVRNYRPDGVLLDYLRYFNRPWQLDDASQIALRARLRAEATADESDGDRRKREHGYKEEHLTRLAREISEALRAEKPGLKIAVYSWGPHVATNHRVAQAWPTWVAEGYIDMVNVSGYYYPEQNGEKYLETFESRLRPSVKFATAAGRAIRVTFALGVETSHGKVKSADDIEKYLNAARRAGVPGTVLFTWNTVQPFLEDLAVSGALTCTARGGNE
jgi:uncharacterized lipoprotein YddW (UPF0748 family)